MHLDVIVDVSNVSSHLEEHSNTIVVAWVAGNKQLPIVTWTLNMQYCITRAGYAGQVQLSQGRVLLSHNYNVIQHFSKSISDTEVESV